MSGTRHNVNLNAQAYEKLKKVGKFGESYSAVILRLVKLTNALELGEK
jgi:predicted CopG family antitoxin